MGKIKKSTRKIVLQQTSFILRFLKTLNDKEQHKLFSQIHNQYDIILSLGGFVLSIKGSKDFSLEVLNNFSRLDKVKNEITREDFLSVFENFSIADTTDEDIENGKIEFLLRHKTNSTTLFKPKTENQKKLITEILTKKIVFGSGSAGTGKTFVAVATALKYLQEKKIDKIIITRPSITAEDFGYLPGDLEDKLGPFLYPILDSLGYLIGKDKRDDYIAKGIIEILPVAFARGITIGSHYRPTIGIIDEAQNLNYKNLKLILTRIGDHKDSKIIFCGDQTQSDLKNKEQKDFEIVYRLLKESPYVGHVDFTNDDVVRSIEVKDILERFDAYETKRSEYGG